MIPRQFEYHAPKTLPDALGLLKQFGDEAKLLAGGHSLLPMMKLRFAQPEHLIDLGKIADLKGIRQDGNTLLIGAMTTISKWTPTGYSLSLRLRLIASQSSGATPSPVF